MGDGLDVDEEEARRIVTMDEEDVRRNLKEGFESIDRTRIIYPGLLVIAAVPLWGWITFALCMLTALVADQALADSEASLVAMVSVLVGLVVLPLSLLRNLSKPRR